MIEKLVEWWRRRQRQIERERRDLEAKSRREWLNTVDPFSKFSLIGDSEEEESE